MNTSSRASRARNAGVYLAILQIAGLLLLLSFGTGCGAISAMANPKVGWALNDPAPMDVVTRRLDAADTTSKEVDRLLTATPAGADSEWLGKTAPQPADAAAQMKAFADDPQYKNTHARVVAAEVWARALALVDAEKGDQPNLLALINADLGQQYERVMAKKREIAEVRKQIGAEEEARDAKGVSDEEKKQHKEKIKELEKRADALEDEVAPLQKELVKNAKDLAAKTPADVRDKIGQALVNLRQAVDDAEIANGAAAVRYPLA